MAGTPACRPTPHLFITLSNSAAAARECRYCVATCVFHHTGPGAKRCHRPHRMTFIHTLVLVPACEGTSVRYCLYFSETGVATARFSIENGLLLLLLPCWIIIGEFIKLPLGLLTSMPIDPFKFM